MITTGLILGVVLGIVLQRGRFCVTGMLRDVVLHKSLRSIVPLLVVIAVQAIGLTALASAEAISTPVDPFAPIAVVLGGFVFGLGIILAGGCASGTWYRSGEGLVGSWFALVTFGLSAAAMKTGILSGFNNYLRGFTVEATTIPVTLGVSPWVFVAAFGVACGYAVYYYTAGGVEKRKATLHRRWWQRTLPPYLAAVLVGVIGIVAWPLSAAAGRNYGLGITGPTANLNNYVVTGDQEFLDWGVLLVLGIFIGATVAAKLAGEFRVRVPDSATVIRSIIGGVLMGVGASLANGCTVGNGMVETALFSYQGWVGLLAIAGGVAVGTRLWIKPTIKGAQPLAVAPVHAAAGVKEIASHTFALDSLGAVCPFPLVDAQQAMSQLESGDKLVIDFDCTQATETIPQWAASAGYTVADFHPAGEAGWQITIVKG